MCRSDESENQEDFIWPCVLIFQKVYFSKKYRYCFRGKNCLYSIDRRRRTFMKKSEKYPAADIDIQSCSATDCTGLIPARPATDEELKNYEELYPYLAKTTPDQQEASK